MNVLSKNFDALKVFIILFIMENHSGKSVATGKSIGRPIIVYDDDSGEKSKPSSSSGKFFIHSIFECIKLFLFRLKFQNEIVRH